MTRYFWSWLSAFAFTELVEAPLYRRALGCSYWVALIPSVLTHPFMWFVLYPRLPLGYGQRVAVCELFVVVVEALWALAWLMRHPHAGGRPARRALLAALLANAASFGLGTLSRLLFFIP
jgi:hypothetical protein